MGKPKVKMNAAGARRVLTSPGAQAKIVAVAAQVQRAANSQLKTSTSSGRFTTKISPGGARARARVVAEPNYAARHNAKHNTLLKALGSGGGG